MKPKLTLVGAGPGDPDLITLKGIKALNEAKVVLYDALANEALLSHAPQDALKIFVGKRGGQRSVPQERINQLILSYASVFGNVVRLKGGDPFIFGRGKEELDFAKRFGIEIEVVPGISSATGLTATQGISLTERGIADGFWVLTASLRDNKFNEDLRIAARSNSTVVVLMGVRFISRIAEEFRNEGKDNLPVLVIQEGSTANEKVISTTVGRLITDAQINKIKAPAVIVLGEVARHENLTKFQPLLAALN